MRKAKTPVVQLSSAQLCELAGPYRERLEAIATKEYVRLEGASADMILRTMQLMVNDYHATLLHLFGLDPKRLTYLRNAQQQVLVGEEGKVIENLLA